MLEHDNFCDATDEKATERADPAVPDKPCQGWQDEADRDCEEMNMAILPDDQRILLEISNIIERRFWPELKQHPAHVSVEETFGDVVRIFLVIDVLMMASMIARPHEDRILKRRGAEDECEQAHW